MQFCWYKGNLKIFSILDWLKIDYSTSFCRDYLWQIQIIVRTTCVFRAQISLIEFCVWKASPSLPLLVVRIKSKHPCVNNCLTPVTCVTWNKSYMEFVVEINVFLKQVSKHLSFRNRSRNICPSYPSVLPIPLKHASLCKEYQSFTPPGKSMFQNLWFFHFSCILLGDWDTTISVECF